MKLKLLFLFIISSFYCFGQSPDSLVCLPKSDVVTLANKIRLLRDSLNYRGKIIVEQDTLIQDQRRLIIVQKDQLKNSKNMYDILKAENAYLEQTIELMRPKWYDNKWLWFGGGAASVLTTIIFIMK